MVSLIIYALHLSIRLGQTVVSVFVLHNMRFFIVEGLNGRENFMFSVLVGDQAMLPCFLPPNLTAGATVSTLKKSI